MCKRDTPVKCMQQCSMMQLPIHPCPNSLEANAVQQCSQVNCSWSHDWASAERRQVSEAPDYWPQSTTHSPHPSRDSTAQCGTTANSISCTVLMQVGNSPTYLHHCFSDLTHPHPIPLRNLQFNICDHNRHCWLSVRRYTYVYKPYNILASIGSFLYIL